MLHNFNTKVWYAENIALALTGKMGKSLIFYDSNEKKCCEYRTVKGYSFKGGNARPVVHKRLLTEPGRSLVGPLFNWHCNEFINQVLNK